MARPNDSTEHGRDGAQQRRSRRLAKSDNLDATATARALPAEPLLGPVQALEGYDALVARIEAMLEHRRVLVQLRTLTLHHIADQLASWPPRSVHDSHL